jgi:hypothetical protein
MRHIVVATDGSADANRAVDVAAELAKAFGAKLFIVTVLYQGVNCVFRKELKASLYGLTRYCQIGTLTLHIQIKREPR